MTGQRIGRVLVANRAEIASRVFATCRRLGIETVAVHSPADAGLRFVTEADFAIELPGNTPGESYLRAQAILNAARMTGADAIHPGYGFLSENAAFAQAVIEAGLIWVGPSPSSMVTMAAKVGAKALMEQAGVPVLSAPTRPTVADLPLLVKASAGGGGRGMRVVRSLDVLDREIAAASAEAESAFGDGTVFVEPYVENGRHVEVQVVGYPEGILVLGDRDCSLQRRHQKVIEEAPAPGIAGGVRAEMHAAARRAAEAVDYLGAGTVEFLFDPNRERFHFLEMNTRLQVEHPVTEAVFGVDLVELQLEVAAGAQLPPEVGEPAGHGIEARLYAEDPAADYQAQSGLIDRFEIPHDAAFSPVRDGVRLDAGFASGDSVSTYYDAMLAKVIVAAPTRERAIARLRSTLRQARIHGPITNREQLIAALGSPDFVAGQVSTSLLGQLEVAQPDLVVLAHAATIALAEHRAARRTRQPGIPVGWRNVRSGPLMTRFEGVDVAWSGGRDGYSFPLANIDVLSASATSVRLRHDEVLTTYSANVVEHTPNDVVVHVDGPDGSASLRVLPRFTDPSDVLATGSLVAPMPGVVLSVDVAVGDSVTAGTKVLVIEAMKMQHMILAPVDGTVSQVNVNVGQQVAAGEVLAVLEEEEQ